MVGYTNEGASDSQWFAASPETVWTATKQYLRNKSLRSCSDQTMRLEVNLGMTAFTGNCIASVSVQPAPQGGCVLMFNGRMGAFSKQNIGAQRRIEDERTKLIAAVAQAVASAPASPTPPTTPAARSTPSLSRNVGGGADLVQQLQQLGDLRTAGVLTQQEFEAAKARLLN